MLVKNSMISLREVSSDYQVWIGIAVVLIFVTVFLVSKIFGKRTPKESSFSCTKCRKREHHSQRTLRAWRDGKHRFFCIACHQTWIRTIGPISPSHSRSGGCLSLLIVGLVGFGAVAYLATKRHKIKEAYKTWVATPTSAFVCDVSM
jgi:hypothetical protein